MLEDLNIFAAVVEQSSMNKAAALLNLSQPALSRKIAKLEDELGAPLFRRIGRRLELTRIGELSYDYALQLRGMHRQYLSTISEFKNTHRSSLTIGASLTTLQTTLPDLIQALTDTHPEIDIKAVTGKTHEIVTLVREKKIDLGLVASTIDDSQLHCVPLFDDHLELVLPRCHLLAEKGDLAISALSGLPMILFSKGSWFRILTDELFDLYRLHPDVKMEIDSFEATLRLLHTCGAATLLPRSYIRPQMLADNDLMVVPVAELGQIKRTTSLIHGDPARLEPSIREWISEAAANYFHHSSVLEGSACGDVKPSQCQNRQEHAYIGRVSCLLFPYLRPANGILKVLYALVRSDDDHDVLLRENGFSLRSDNNSLRLVDGDDAAAIALARVDL